MTGIQVFTARGCGHCIEQKHILAQVEQSIQPLGVAVEVVDVQEHEAIATRAGITATPTAIALHGGREVTRHLGIASEAELRLLAMRAQHGL